MAKNSEEHQIQHVLEVTTVVGCKVSCCYCPQEKFVNAYKKISDIYRFDFDNFKALLATVPGEVDIYFCGMSEPFLHPQCAEMISYAWQKGYRIALDTSLVGVTQADVDLLKDIPLLFLALHLPSSQGEEKIKVDDNYLAILDSILAGGLNCQDLHLHYYGNELHEKIDLGSAEQMPLFSRGGTIQVSNSALPGRFKGEIGCDRNHRNNVLLPNGDVLLCSTDWEMKHVLGNLNETDYQTLFKGKAFLDIVAGMKDEKADILCRFCESHTHDVNLKAKIMNFIPNAQKSFKFIKAGRNSGNRNGRQ
jgi:Iron-sulfur cluster-binding domain